MNDTERHIHAWKATNARDELLEALRQPRDEDRCVDALADYLHSMAIYGHDPEEIARKAMEHYRYETDPANAEEMLRYAEYEATR